MILEMFQNTTPKSNPKIGLMNARNATIIIETETGSISRNESSIPPKINW